MKIEIFFSFPIAKFTRVDCLNFRYLLAKFIGRRPWKFRENLATLSFAASLKRAKEDEADYYFSTSLAPLPLSLSLLRTQHN